MALWYWPVPGNNRITSGVGPRWGTQHKGIDIAAPKDSKIIATRDGVVTRINTNCTHNFPKDKSCGCGGGYGNFVYIDHKDGYLSRYAHMTDVNVRVGQRVSKGDVVGTVGSTGYSTGNHLHFEVRYKDIVQDPEKLVSPDNTTHAKGTPVVNDSVSNKSAAVSTGSLGYDSGASSSGSVVPLSSRDILERQAFHAYVKFYVGDKEINYIDGVPSKIQRFEMNRLENAGNTANFVLFDDDWDSLEPLLAKNYNNVSVEYGYSEGNYKSPRYKMQLSDYSIDFLNTGILLSIKAISLGVYENLQRQNHHTNTKNPTKAIEAICKFMGWEIDLSNFPVTKDIDREEDYKLVNDNPISYIINTILPEAITDLGETLSFVLENGVASLVTNTFDTEDSDDIPTYVYQKGYDSVIEDLSFNTKGIFGGTTQFETVTQMEGSSFDPNTKEEINRAEDIDSTLTVATGEYSSTKKEQSTANYMTAGETESQLSARLTYHIKNGANQAYEANLTMLGDPNIRVKQKVRIINITDSGYLHHTSGIYMVTGVTDSVENGNFRTTLKLIRNGDISNGIVMKSPKALKK